MAPHPPPPSPPGGRGGGGSWEYGMGVGVGMEGGRGGVNRGGNVAEEKERVIWRWKWVEGERKCRTRRGRRIRRG